ncbi:MAG TPA: pyridoxal 5'-phosphate synthase [Glaciihabitans sp.]|jgi:pyridoxamine 5'-phosphate oxidase|nr:pyridoxal 5'-phosphate synthase [Glaciihabitans sp.]
MNTGESLRDRLRAAKVFGGELPYFNTDAAPEAPLPLLVEWLGFALDSGVSQPQAMSLATASANGVVSNRTLLLKDVDDNAVWFASLSNGPKGQDLAENPRAALLLYWREQGRQIRIVGSVEAGPREVSEADFLARHPNARTMAIAGQQSEPITDFSERMDAARALVEADSEYVPDSWTAYRVIPQQVEFWQAERERDQVRLRYTRTGPSWTRELIWP